MPKRFAIRSFERKEHKLLTAARLIHEGKLSEALVAYDSVLVQRPNDLCVQRRRADLLCKMNLKREAFGAYVRIAEAYSNEGLIDRAIAACNLALAINNQHIEVRRKLTDLYASKAGWSERIQGQ